MEFGILGGMGPKVGCVGLEYVVELFQRKGAYRDADFPRGFLFNLPLPDIVETIDDEKKVRGVLLDGLNMMLNLGVKRSIVACVSAHAFLSEGDVKFYNKTIGLISLPNIIQGLIDQYPKAVVFATETTKSIFLFPLLKKI